MSEDRRTRLKRWLESGEVSLQPLTFPQRELWESSPVPVADPSNHICTFIEVRGLLTAEDCYQAIQGVINRQEVMRLSILPGKDQPVQMIRSIGTPKMQYRQLSSPSERRPEAVEQLMQEAFSEPFDLVQGPLYRVNVLRRDADDHLLVLTIHHAIADGWSLGTFVQDLCATHLLRQMGKSEDLPAVELSHGAWGAAERAFWKDAEIDQHIPFWKSQLAGAQRLLRTPVDLPAMAAPLQRIVSYLPVSLGRAARDLARRHGVTLFSTLLTVFRIALSRWMDAHDIVVGTPVANRSKQSIRETMGYFSGVVPLRGAIDHDRPFSESLRAVHQTSVDCFAHAIPFTELARAIGDRPHPGHTPLFDVRFALQNHPVPDAVVSGMAFKLRMRSTGTARFHLGCEITENGEALEVVWVFRPKLFPKEEINNLGSLFEAVLAQVAHMPESRTAPSRSETR
jgi:condensation domain-containing protein